MRGACECGARIRWAVTVNGRRMPLNADPDPTGNIRLEDRPEGPVEAIVMTAEEMAGLSSSPRFKSHYATCPLAAKFREPKPRPDFDPHVDFPERFTDGPI